MEAGQDTVLKLINAAEQAGALSIACRDFPESRDGLNRAYEWHHARTAILVDEIAKAGPGKVSSVRMSAAPKR